MKVKFVIKPRAVMGDYIGLHWLENDGFSIPYGEVWIREDVWNTEYRRVFVILHELYELNLMVNYGYDYKMAHTLATRFENRLIDILEAAAGLLSKYLSSQTA